MATTSVTVMSKGRSAIAGGESLKAESKQLYLRQRHLWVGVGGANPASKLRKALDQYAGRSKTRLHLDDQSRVAFDLWKVKGQKVRRVEASQPKGGFIPSRLFKKENMDSCRAFRCL